MHIRMFPQTIIFIECQTIYWNFTSCTVFLRTNVCECVQAGAPLPSRPTSCAAAFSPICVKWLANVSTHLNGIYTQLMRPFTTRTSVSVCVYDMVSIDLLLNGFRNSLRICFNCEHNFAVVCHSNSYNHCTTVRMLEMSNFLAFSMYVLCVAPLSLSLSHTRTYYYVVEHSTHIGNISMQSGHYLLYAY